MGTNDVTESLRHNENLSDLPFERKTVNHTGCTSYKYSSSTYILFAEISSHGSECRSSERPKLAPLQPIFFGRLKDIEHSGCQDDVLSTIEVADYLQAFGSAVLVVRTVD